MSHFPLACNSLGIGQRRHSKDNKPVTIKKENFQVPLLLDHSGLVKGNVTGCLPAIIEDFGDLARYCWRVAPG